MQRYFASRGKDGRIVIRDDDIFHFVKVARAKLGEEFELSIDGEVFHRERDIIRTIFLRDKKEGNCAR
jgi:16S rRNA U1498 N3-methylase RsmE